jgi:hypothetical protein
MRSLRRISIFIAVVALLAIRPPDLRGDYFPTHPDYPRLNTRALGMGGAAVAWIDDGSSIFQNPAGMGRIRSLTISHSHSRNHFPGEIENLDQLDADPTSLLIPLNGALLGWPIGSAGTGWVLQGELGYDYRTTNDLSVPRERLFGMGPGDRREGAGFHLWPGGFFGFTHRMSEYLFTSGSDLPDGVTWRRSGEGYSAGLQQIVIPGLQYGAVFEQMDYDYLPYRDNITAEREKTFRSGWSIRPTAWLLIARDTETVNRREWPEGEGVTPTITGIVRDYWGVEISVGRWLQFRWGSFDGHPTSGWSYRIGPWRSDSAWVDGLMTEMVEGFPSADEYPEPMLDESHDITDYHPTGFDLQF